MDARDKMKRGVILLNKHHPFFAYVLFDVKLQPFPETYAGVRTMAVSEDGRCWYDEAFVDGMTTATMGMEPGEVARWGELEGVLCHEALHLCLAHLKRIEGRIPELANYAMDIVVNYYVLSEGLSLPKEAIPVNPKGCNGEGQSDVVICGVPISIQNIKRKSWEEVYDELHGPLQKAGKIVQVQQQGTPGKGDSSKGFDQHDRSGVGEDGNERSDEEREKIRRHWENRLCEAAAHAKQQGKIPAGMERLIDGLVKPKVHWRQLLQRHVKASLNPVDWSWHKPHRKTEALGVYMPTIWKEVIDVEVIVDTSGSIGGSELTEFLSEIVGMAKQFSYVRMFVTFVDAEVQKRYELTNGATSEILRMQPKGGGGTRMLSGIEYIKKHNAEAKVVVVLTDGCDNYEGRKARDFPFEVVWCLSKNGVSIESHKQNCRFGSVVKIDG